MAAKKYPFKRLLPGDVRKQYVKKSVKAVRHVWRAIYNGEQCGCALTTCFLTTEELDAGARDDLTQHQLRDELFSRAKKAGYVDEYLRAFVDGFDDGQYAPELKRPEDYCEAQRVGAEDGKSAWELLLKHGLTR